VSRAQKQTDQREHELEQLRRDIQATERRVKNAQELLLYSAGSERDLHRASLRAELALLDALKASLRRAPGQPGTRARREHLGRG
jgi:hypothetical protein